MTKVFTINIRFTIEADSIEEAMVSFEDLPDNVSSLYVHGYTSEDVERED